VARAQFGLYEAPPMAARSIGSGAVQKLAQCTAKRVAAWKQAQASRHCSKRETEREAPIKKI
jgi:hypothetical protein